MRQELVIRGLPQAFEVKEEMGFSSEGWEADYRVASREALKGILEERMASRMDRELQKLLHPGGVDHPSVVSKTSGENS